LSFAFFGVQFFIIILLSSVPNDSSHQRLDSDLPLRQVAVYANTSKQIGDPEKVFANANASEALFAENDPEGAAFEYEVLE